MMKYVIFFILTCCTFNLSGQTARLTIQSGGHVDFHFQLLAHYNNGVTYTNWTHLSIFYDDDGTAFATWKLDVNAQTAVIQGGSGAGSTLPLETIEFEVNPGTSGATANNDAAHARLSAAPLSLLVNGPETAPGNESVYITYHCGTSHYGINNSLIGKSPDYYYVPIVFDLGPE